jgi:co-chaperonin GroES (HSP10)
MKLKPIAGKILVHPIEVSPFMSSGLIKPDMQRTERTKQGIVIGKGPLCSDDIEIADHVLFNPYSGDEIALGSGGFYFLIPEEHIIAIRLDSDVVLMDTETVKRLLNERKGEVLQKYMDDVEKTRIASEIFESIIDRVNSITRAEAFQW